MVRKVFLVIKTLLFLVGFTLAANHYPNAPLFMALFWLVFNIESAIYSYREEKNVALGFDMWEFLQDFQLWQ